MSATLGYETRRDQLEAFVDEHYIRAFNLKPCRMLDIGCGDGFWADIFARRGYTVIGIDRDTAALDTARARRDEDDVNPLYVAGDLDNEEHLRVLFDVNPSPFPLIFARTVPHFYQRDLSAGAQLVERLVRLFLASPGILLLSIYTDQSGKTRDGATHHTLNTLINKLAVDNGIVGWAKQTDEYVQLALVGPSDLAR